ncbi:MAG: flippase-like domain-containing protein [Candidatus Micrarchaeota archaeon]|nr:flippase-like domain-containing protein [Candidatus Micrarchaeota archaeon]
MAEKKTSLWYVITHQTKMNRAQYLKLINRVTLFVAGGFAVSIAVFFVIAWLGGIANVAGDIASSKLDIYALAFVSVLAGVLLRFVKWSYYLKKFRLKLPTKRSLAVYLSMYAMDLTPGNIGRIVAAYTLSRVTRAEIVQVIPIVTMDIFTDSLGFALLTIITSVYYNQYTLIVLLADMLLLVPVFLFLINPWFYRLLKGGLKKNSFLKIFSIYGDEYFAAQSILNKPDVYAVSILVTVPSAALTAASLYFALVSIGLVGIPVGHSIFILSTSQLFGMISTIPGNIGVTDGSLIALIQGVFGATPTQASAATIMVRLATLWFGIIMGTLFLFYTLRYWREPKSKLLKETRDGLSSRSS